MQQDSFDYYEEDERKSPRDGRAMAWNVLTILVLLTALCIGGVFLTIFINPQISFNPFPPPTLPVLAGTNTPTPTLRSILPPTWTPTSTTAPSSTPTPEPTYTLTPEGAQPTVEVKTEETSEGMPFVMQEGNPQYIPNIYHPDAGCNWMGVGGQVIGLNGGPVLYLSIKLGGSLNGEAIDLITISGTAPQYGQAGYEFKLSDQPIDSVQNLFVQLLDQADLPLSDKYYFDTFNDCEKNLILINFKQMR